MDEVYLDYNATTPLEPRVRDAMLPWMGAAGNASSVHAFGRRAREAVETAREEVALLIGAAPDEVIFTASGTEANNTVFETVLAQLEPGRLVISAFEHPSVTRAAERLAERGFEVVAVRPGADGVIDAAAVAAALDDDTRLVCVMLANNEIGSVQPVAEIAARARDRGALVLCDAVQAAGKVPFSVAELDVDYLSIGAHKFYGPLGAAALWVRRGAPLDPLLVGGSQERYRRASTSNIPALVGFGEAARLAREEGARWAERMRAVRDRFESRLGELPEAVVHAAAAPRLPNTSNVAFPGLSGEALMVRLDLRGFAVSTGSACSSGKVSVSATMAALGVPQEEALGSLRISFGKDTPLEVADRLVEALAAEVAELHRAAPAEARS